MINRIFLLLTIVFVLHGISLVSAQCLDDMHISPVSFYNNSKSSINILVYDSENVLCDPDDISIKIENYTNFPVEIIRTQQGNYTAVFDFSNISQQNLHANITAKYRSKQLSEISIIYLPTQPFSSQIISFISSYAKKISNLLSDYSYEALLTAIIFVLSTFAFLLYRKIWE